MFVIKLKGKNLFLTRKSNPLLRDLENTIVYRNKIAANTALNSSMWDLKKLGLHKNDFEIVEVKIEIL